MKQIEFKGTGNEYFNIWIVNILLCIVTLGIYYPWAKVRTRRYFYANTVYEGRNFEYHATGGKLFVGYLIGIGLLILMSILNSVFPLSNFITPIILFIGVPWLIWRSLKFNARMTSFSNVRFGFDGSLGQAFFNYMLLPILGFVAFYLPLALLAVALFAGEVDSQIPNFSFSMKVFAFIVAIIGLLFSLYMSGFTKKKITDYAIGKSRFGQGSFVTNVSTKEFTVILLKAGLLAFGIFVALVLLISPFISMLGSLSNGIEDAMGANTNLGLFFSFLPLVYLSFIAGSLLIRAFYYSRNRQYIYANTQLDNKINFKSTVQTKPYFWITFTNMILMILTAGMARPWTKVREARYIANNTWIDATDTDIDSYLTQKQAEQSAIGEEIGDVFDVDVGIGL